MLLHFFLLSDCINLLDLYYNSANVTIYRSPDVVLDG